MFEDSDWLVSEPCTSQHVKVKSEIDESKVERISSNGKKFKCNEENCNFSSNFNYELKRHITVHSEERPHKCDKCEKEFKRSDSLKKHLNLHVSDKGIRLLNARKLSPEERNEPSEEIHATSTPIRCKLCDYSCKSKISLSNHFLLKHTIMEPFQCDYPDCNYTTHLELYLTKHKHAHELEKRFKCDKCELVFRTQSNWKQHSFVHSKEKPLKCDKCQYSCTFMSMFRVHILRKHVNEKEHKCEECGDSYHLKAELEKHKLNHNDEKRKFKCHLCSFRTHTNMYLRKHIQRHKDIGRYKCDKCDRSFNKVQSLNRHKFIHSKTKNIECDQCEYRTNNPTYLRKHLLITHKSVSSANNASKCDQRGLILKNQSDSCMHQAAHRLSFVPPLAISHDIIDSLNFPQVKTEPIVEMA